MKRVVGTPFVLTVDVEPDWGVRGDRAAREVIPRLLELLERHRVSATFFIVATLLDSCADVLRPLAGRHEVGSHGLTHRRLDRLAERDVELELGASRRRLEDALGTSVIGFRAPFLRPAKRWFEKLARAGYCYDCSMGSVWPSWKNVGPAKWRLTRNEGVVEMPPATLRTGLIPFSLTYLRLLAPVGERLVSPRGTIMYLHPHELADPRLTMCLRPPLRWALRRKVGEPAWGILERLLARVAPRATTCRQLLEAHRRGTV